jgi:hypothetical protein
MSEVIDYFRDMKAIEKERRAENRATGPEALTAAGFLFDVKNAGTHLIVRTNRGLVDYWPGTEKWMVRGERTRNGLDNFLAEFQPVGTSSVAQPVEDDQIQWKSHMSEFTVRTYQDAGFTVILPETYTEQAQPAVEEFDDIDI